MTFTNQVFFELPLYFVLCERSDASMLDKQSSNVCFKFINKQSTELSDVIN